MSQEKKQRQKSYIWIYGVVVAGLIAWSLFSNKGNPVEVNWDIVKYEFIKKGTVEKIEVIKNKEIAEVYIKEQYIDSIANSSDKYKGISKSSSSPQFVYEFATLENFEKELAEERAISPEPIGLKYVNETSIWDGIFGFLPFLIIIGFSFYLMRRMSRGSGGGGGGGNVFNVGKAKAQIYDKNSTARITFKEVAGLSEVKIEIMEIVDFLKNPKKYSDLGGKIPKGALLIGPPGTGKTLLAKAVAGEADVPFLSISGSDFVEMFVGVGASRVRDLFKQAKEKAPCIVFIDEIDAIGRARSKNGGYSSNDERENTLNQMLTEMDGFGTNSGVIILAATNRADILDKALTRAGRFDRQINVELPNQNEREEIIDVHIRNLKLGTDFDIPFFAKQTPGFSGADIANMCNEAALIAARKDKTQVEKQDFFDAIDRIIGGLERKSRIITAKEKKIIAYHEAGHATVSWLLEYASPLIKVTIVPRGKALGAAWYLPGERQITTKEQLMHDMVATLGGRAAEEIIFGEISTGALSDLEKVTKQAYSMIAYYGMGKDVANTSYYNSSSNETFTKPYSEATAQVIDKESMLLIEEAYKSALKILRDNIKGLTALAEMLLDKEVVFNADLEPIFGKRITSEEAIEEVKAVEVSEESEIISDIKTDEVE